MRTCPHCEEEKEDSEFYARKLHGKVIGISGWCRACTKEQARESSRRRRAAEQAERGGKRARLTPLDLHVREMFRRAQRSSSFKGLTDFSLTFFDVDHAVRTFCATNYYEVGNSPFAPSIDRIDNSKGYTPQNVRIVWRIENLARNVFTDEQVIEFCRRKLGLL